LSKINAVSGDFMLINFDYYMLFFDEDRNNDINTLKSYSNFEIKIKGIKKYYPRSDKWI